MEIRLSYPTTVMVLNEEVRKVRERWARRPITARALALRPRIVLRAAARQMSIEIAAAPSFVRPRPATGDGESPNCISMDRAMSRGLAYRAQSATRRWRR